MYTVYCHTFPHGKVYVGITRQKPEYRWKHGKGYYRCPAMGRAVLKYGWENIDHDIIAEVETLEEAERLERYLIAFWDSTNRKNGYNILPGGVATQSPLPEETRRKISEKAKGRCPTEETRRKLSKSLRERWSDEDFRQKNLSSRSHRAVNCGKVPSKETRLKMSHAHKGKQLGDKSPCSKSVLQFTEDGVFIRRWGSIREIERAGVTSRANVVFAAAGKYGRKTAGGFVWKFESDVEKVIDKTL